MENLDIIILSSIVSILFVIFLVVVYKELTRSEDDYVITEDNGVRTKLIKKVGSIFDSQPNSTKPKRKDILKDKLSNSIE